MTPRRDKDGDRDLFSDNPEDAAHNLFTTVVRGLGSLGIAMVNVGLPEASMITVPYKVKGLIDSPELHNY